MKFMLQLIEVSVVGQAAKRANVQRVILYIVLTLKKSFLPVFETDLYGFQTLNIGAVAKIEIMNWKVSHVVYNLTTYCLYVSRK
jgi:hypothetical protein